MNSQTGLDAKFDVATGTVVRLPGDNPACRLTGLDWLRAGATLCVVMLHTGIPYMTHTLPGLIWSTYTDDPSPAINALAWWIDIWVMPLFFVMSGYFAFGLREKHGRRQFLRHRLARIGGPLLFGMVFILPLSLYAWMVSWANQGWIDTVKLRSLKLDGPYLQALLGTAHLWYLQYLLLYCVGITLLSRTAQATRPLETTCRCALRTFWCRLWGEPSVSRSIAEDDVLPLNSTADERGERSLADPNLLYASIARTLILGTIMMLLLWQQPRILIGFRHGFFPFAANFAFFACWFFIGWRWGMTRVQPSLRIGLAKLATGIVLFPFVLGMINSHVEDEMFPTATMWLPGTFVACSWLLATGLFELSLATELKPPRPVAYVAEASFWIYLLHHPVAGLAQGNMAQLAWSTEVKFAVATFVGVVFPLLTYHVWVRETWVGRLLNGRKHKSSLSPKTVSPPTPVPEPAVERKAA